MQIISYNSDIVSLYQNIKTDSKELNFFEVLNDIKSKRYNESIKSIRYAINKGNQKKADEIKITLPAFTTSGTFSQKRTKETISSYSQIVCLDFDDILVSEIESAVVTFNEDPFTLASFISPSGQGIKVFVRIDSTIENHNSAYEQVSEYYQRISNLLLDNKCKDITRLCFVSSDENCYINRASMIFQVKTKSIKEVNKNNILNNNCLDSSDDSLLDQCLKFTELKEQYYNGNRNNFIFQFACNANKLGIDREAVLNFCTNTFDLEEREIKATVNSTYSNQFADFAKSARFAKLQTLQELNESEELVEEIDNEYNLKNTPLIPQIVYDNLPPILYECCKVFAQPRERDTFLTGALSIISGCLPNVSGVYGGSKVYTSTFSFVLAPAASGKGALKFSKALADKYHEKVLAESIEEKKRYDENLEAYKLLKAKGKLEPNQEMPIPPKFKVVFIPANTSSAKMIQHLAANDGRGIICETEADTLGQAWGNDWGSYSDMARKSHHHEKISISRKTDGEYVEVNEPQFSMALSGTPEQVYKIIPSAEDGLFSRFQFYVFKTDAIWLDPSPKGNPTNLTEFFSQQSGAVSKMVEYYENDEMILHLTDNQWNILNYEFRKILDHTSTFVNEDALSVVKRLGLVLYRYCMIFTAIRKYAAKNYLKDIYCSDQDFNTALQLALVYLQHNIFMYNNLPKQADKGLFKAGNNKELFFEALPSSFSRKEAVELGKKYNLAERSADGFLKSCVGKYLQQPRTGHYEKIEKALN